MMLSRGLHRVLTEAYRRADQSGRAAVGTQDLLLTMADLEFHVGSALVAPAGPGGRGSRPGRFPTGTTPVSEQPEITGPLRLVRWWEVGSHGRRRNPRRDVVPEWGSDVLDMLSRARQVAVAEQAPYVGNRHALAVLVAAPDGPVADLLAEHSVSYDRLGEVLAGRWPETEDAAWGSVTEFLRANEVLVTGPGQESHRLRTAALAAVTRLGSSAGFVLFSLEQDAVAQAVQLGHDVVLQEHLLLAVVDLEERVAAAGLHFASRYAAANEPLLTPAGYTWYETVRAAVAPTGAEPVGGKMSRRSWRHDPESPRWSATAAGAAEEARRLAKAGRTQPGTRHLLRAIRQEPDDSVGALLFGLGRELPGDGNFRNGQ